MPRIALVLFLLALPACGAPTAPTTADQPTGPEWFRDVTDEVGLDFRQHAGPTGKFLLPQVMGSGLALVDADNDGRMDLLLLNNAGRDSKVTHRFYRQGPDGKFRDATAGSGFDFAGAGMGAAVGDFDNDGFADVYVSQYDGGRLLRNKGDGTFADITAAAGVGTPHWGTSCTFLDYDRDGWLDLVVVNYVDYVASHTCTTPTGEIDFCHPNQFVGAAARLFHNKGNGTFEDVTGPSGLGAVRTNGLGVIAADFDNDGWVDILAANDAKANTLWLNRRNGTFEEAGVARGVAFNGAGNTQSNMGVVYSDLDGDGRPDVYITHLSEELHTLWRQFVPGRFADQTAKAGLANPRWRGTGFGVVAADFNLDGHPDLAIANGRVMRSRAAPLDGIRPDLPEFWRAYAERNQLFANAGDGTFTDISANSPAFTLPPGVYRGLAWTDLNSDGAVDLIATSIEGPARVFHNVAPKKGKWLIARAYDPVRKRDAIGAMITVKAGGRTWLGFANPGQSYCTSGDPRAFFGLGDVSAIDEVLITWPDGARESFPAPGSNLSLTFNRGQGRPVTP